MMAATLATLATLALALGSAPARLQVGDCYDILEQLTITAASSPVLCTATTTREADGCFLLCGVCATPALRFGLNATDRQLYCKPPTIKQPHGGISQAAVAAASSPT